MIILVTGSRYWVDRQGLGDLLGEVAAGADDVLLRHGKCDPRHTVLRDRVPWDKAMRFRPEIRDALLGADWLAHLYAMEHGWRVEAYPADWRTNNRAAGAIRNAQMVRLEPRADIVVGFPCRDSRGTVDCLNRAYRAAIPIRTPS